MIRYVHVTQLYQETVIAPRMGERLEDAPLIPTRGVEVTAEGEGTTITWHQDIGTPVLGAPFTITIEANDA